MPEQNDTTLAQPLPGLNDPAAAGYGFGGGAQDPYIQAMIRRQQMAAALRRNPVEQEKMLHWASPLASVANRAVELYGQHQSEQNILEYQAKQQAQGDALSKSVMDAIRTGNFGALGGGGDTPQGAPSPVATAPAPPPPSPDDGVGVPPALASRSSVDPAVARDYGVRTMLAEDGRSQEGMEGVAHVIRNRVNSGRWGDNAQSVVLAPRQFSPWNLTDGNDPRRFKPDSPEYARAAQIWDAAHANGAVDPTGGAMNFANVSAATAPWVSQAMGRDPSTRTNIGGHTFFRGLNEGAPTPAAQSPTPGAMPVSATSGQPPAVPGTTAQIALATPPAGAMPGGRPPMTQAQRMMLGAAMLDMQGRGNPQTAAIARGLRAAAAAYPDAEWATAEVGGNVIAYDKKNPARSIVLGTAASNTLKSLDVFNQNRAANAPYAALPDSPEVIAAKRAVAAPYPAVPDSPEREAQVNRTAPPTIVSPGQALVSRGATSPSYINPAAPEKPPPGYQFGPPVVEGGAATLRPVPGGDAEIKRADGLRAEFTKLAEPYRQVQDAHHRIVEAAKKGSGAGDIAIISGYMKLLDPTTGVLQGEYATAEKVGSIPERVWGQYNRALNGDLLTPAMRRDFIEQSRALFSVYQRSYEQSRSEFKRLAELSNVNPDLVMPDFANSRNPPPGQPQTPAQAADEGEDMDSAFRRALDPQRGTRPTPPARRFDPTNPLGLVLPGAR